MACGASRPSFRVLQAVWGEHEIDHILSSSRTDKAPQTCVVLLEDLLLRLLAVYLIVAIASRNKALPSQCR